MLIVDEAHHLAWSPQQVSPEYQFIEQLAQQIPSLILLTATPEQLGKASHFARLRLLDPDRFYHLEKFLEEERHFEPLAQAARLLLNQQALPLALQNTLKQQLHVENIEDLLQQSNNKTKRDELLSLLIDHHGTGRVLFRNSRKTVSGFPARQYYGYPLKPTMTNLDWLADKLQQLKPQKVLLICQHLATVLTLSQQLKKQWGIANAVFHEDMSIIERDRSAAYFADSESKAQLLICSEIGSEGRNFQFVHHLILLELPENPDLLQQRIGRLDRIGQHHTIQLHIPYQINSRQQILYRWYDEGLNAFQQNNNAATQVYNLQQQQLKQLLHSATNYADLDSFIQQSQQLSQELTQQLQLGRDLLLELNSCRPEIAETIIEQIQKLDHQTELSDYLELVFDCYGVEQEYHSEDCTIIKAGNHLRLSHFPELPEEGITATTNRNKALNREDISFLSWEHPLVSAAMDLVLSSTTGNACISVVKHPQFEAGQYLLEILFIVECSAPAYLQLERFLPATPIRIVINQEGNNFSETIHHHELIDSGQKFDKIQISAFLNQQRETINQRISQAQSYAEKIMAKQIEDSHQQLSNTLNQEIQRLTRLQRSNPTIKPQEIEQQQNQLKIAQQQLQTTQLKLDAVRFIICS